MNLSDLRSPPLARKLLTILLTTNRYVMMSRCKLAFSNKHASRLFDDALQFSVIVNGVVANCRSAVWLFVPQSKIATLCKHRWERFFRSGARDKAA